MVLRFVSSRRMSVEPTDGSGQSTRAGFRIYVPVSAVLIGHKHCKRCVFHVGPKTFCGLAERVFRGLESPSGSHEKKHTRAYDYNRVAVSLNVTYFL